MEANNKHSDEPDTKGNNTGRVRGNPQGMGASMLHWGKPCAQPPHPHPNALTQPAAD